MKEAERRLLRASEKGDAETVRRILSEEQVDVDVREDRVSWAMRAVERDELWQWFASGWTPLHWASTRGHIDVVKVLLEAKASVEARTMGGCTPLHFASDEGHVDVVKVLLEAKANVDARNKGGCTPLHNASLGGHVDVVKVLLEAKADVEALDKDGSAPLHNASLGGHIDVVKVLLEGNANVETQDTVGQTALHVASHEDHADVVELLLGCCNVSTLDKNGWTPVHLAIHNDDTPGCFGSRLGAGKMAVLRTLATHGAKWDSKCNEMIDNGEAIPEARALAVCFGLWEREYAMKLPLTDIPHEVASKDVTDVEIYVRACEQSRELINRIKVCLVGPSGWGKTSLAQSVTTASSCLRHHKDRTIGIDHWTRRIQVPVPGENKVKVYEVTFWDFAGQDAYQVVHSLFFSYRTLYLVTVDLQSYAAALAQAKLLSFNKDQMSRLVDDFIDTKIFKWIRVVLARQPDAEFAFVFTKADVLHRNSARVEKVRRDLVDRLRRYGEESNDAIGRLNAAESGGASGFGEVLHDVTGLRFTPVRDGLEVHEHGALQESLRRLSQPKSVVVSCKDCGGVELACLQLDQVIVESNRAFPVPDLYSQVLDYVREKPVDLFDENVHDLNLALVKRIGGSSFDRPACEAILRVLHHLGDVLWYEDLEVQGLSDTVILNPMPPKLPMAYTQSSSMREAPTSGTATNNARAHRSRGTHAPIQSPPTAMRESTATDLAGLTPLASPSSTNMSSRTRSTPPSARRSPYPQHLRTPPQAISLAPSPIGGGGSARPHSLSPPARGSPQQLQQGIRNQYQVYVRPLVKLFINQREASADVLPDFVASGSSFDDIMQVLWEQFGDKVKCGARWR